jgi:hypothetical protein
MLGTRAETSPMAWHVPSMLACYGPGQNWLTAWPQVFGVQAGRLKSTAMQCDQLGTGACSGARLCVHGGLPMGKQ